MRHTAVPVYVLHNIKERVSRCMCARMDLCGDVPSEHRFDTSWEIAPSCSNLAFLHVVSIPQLHLELRKLNAVAKLAKKIGHTKSRFFLTLDIAWQVSTSEYCSGGVLVCYSRVVFRRLKSGGIKSD